MANCFNGLCEWCNFGCPAHDQRDFDFAKKYQLPIIRVVSDKKNSEPGDKMKEAFTGDGLIINSEFLNGLSIFKAQEKVINRIEKDKLGKKQIMLTQRLGCFKTKILGLSYSNDLFRGRISATSR